MTVVYQDTTTVSFYIVSMVRANVYYGTIYAQSFLWILKSYSGALLQIR